MTHEGKRRRDQAFLRGMKRHKDIITKIGKLSGSDIVRLLEDHLAALGEQKKARAHYQDCVRRERLLEAKVSAISGSIRLKVHASYTDPKSLHDFGLVPYKPTGPKTPAVIVQAAGKADATRKARHTLGKRQKESVTGRLPA
jgi:hypothetical protein